MIVQMSVYQEMYQSANKYIFIIFNKLKILAFSGKIK